ncbi:MAG TPA: ferric reductase-like transmembrane domain-containing protein [Ilumatobacteraceae bacterium]|nr:ferric reductase-like transmembrane domain-containing protein [Ilumatobacteraceae bacterium]
MNPQFWWYVTRASGIVAWLMLTASVIWGVILSTKAFPEQRRPAWILDLHRWLGGLTVSFVAIHLAALVADNFVHFTLIDLAVPFASDWKPGAVALGVIATWLLVAVELTSLAMRRLPKRVWRAIHLSSYAVFWLASIHAALAGTDRSQRLYQVTAAASIIAVAWALMYRVANRRSIGPPTPTRGLDRAAARKAEEN